MSDESQQQDLPSWLKKVLVFAIVGAVCFLLAYNNAQQRVDPQLKAAQQLGRDLDAIAEMPEHRRLSEFIEALDRANKASPDLADSLLTSGNEGTQLMGKMLLAVKNNPNLTDPAFQEQLSTLLQRCLRLQRGDWGEALKQ